MKYSEIPGIDKPVSRIVQGCTMLKDGDAQGSSDALLDEVFSAGINAFDHAWQYGNGECERAFGNWLNARGNRDDVVIIDKGCHPIDGISRVSPAVAESDINDSLRRLGVENIDLWLFHRDDPAVPVAPLVEMLNEMLDAGKISAFGGSNWTLARIQEANNYAARKGLVGFSASSPHFSLAEQIRSPWGDDCVTISGPSHEDSRTGYAQAKLGVLCWSSLAGGFFSGRFSRARRGEMLASLPQYTVDSYESEDNWRRLERANELATAKGVTVAQIAIAYVLCQAMNAFALVRSGNSETLALNLEAVNVELSPAELCWLDLRRDAR